jgi:hypothetical protein
LEAVDKNRKPLAGKDEPQKISEILSPALRRANDAQSRRAGRSSTYGKHPVVASCDGGAVV